jgi:hypothetical protein
MALTSVQCKVLAFAQYAVLGNAYTLEYCCEYEQKIHKTPQPLLYIC